MGRFAVSATGLCHVVHTFTKKLTEKMMVRINKPETMAVAKPEANVPGNSAHANNRKQWRLWLEKHHARKDGVWLVLWKKSSGRAQLTYGEAVEEALCFGWIDSKPNKLDAQRSLLWFAPRKPGTGWSRLNKTRIEQLLATRQMAPAGLARVEAAKADGSWNALDAVENLEVPQDLRLELSKLPAAAAFFDGFPRSAKRSILEWIADAKTQTTRTKRIAETATLAAVNKRANQWRK
jgi:uncharacterized protein YdeI (YjbR/CyaY-like superfamily)